MKIFAACSLGIEDLLEDEIKTLFPYTVCVKTEGGVEWTGDKSDIYKANLYLRIPNRILMRLAEFPVTGWAELIRKSSRIPWNLYINKDLPLSFNVTCKRSRLYHSKGVEERIILSIEKNTGFKLKVIKHKEDEEQKSQLIVVRIINNLCTISLDTSGESLYKRGYKKETLKAPLRETLAAAIIKASGWDKVSPLIDPFCGSGTIIIEAALIAKNIPPGLNRKFIFMLWPDFDNKLWNSIINNAKKSITDSVPVLIGSDRDNGAIESAKANAKRANVAEYVSFERKTISELSYPFSNEKIWIVTNPPYGKRLKEKKDLRNLYAKFGNVIKENFSDVNLNILCYDRKLLYQTGLELKKTLSFNHGGLNISMYKGIIKKSQ